MALVTIFAAERAEVSSPSFRQGRFGLTLAAGAFLLIIAFINSVILKDIIGSFKTMKRNRHEAQDQPQQSSNGLVNRAI